MTDKPEYSPAKLKVKRTRTRLYEPPPPDTAAEPGTSDSKLSRVQQEKAGSKLTSAHRIINRYTAFSAGTALVPLPILDMVAVTAIEIRMLKRLSDHYNLAFSQQRGKVLIGSLLGGFHAGLFTGSLLKTVPIIGFGGALVSMAVGAGALTYAVGKVFARHFESGGTLLDFDPAKARPFLETEIKEGKRVASKRKK